MNNFIKIFLIIITFCINSSFAQQGCCSGHGGQSYCNFNGNLVCNDGTYSSTCVCSNNKRYKELKITKVCQPCYGVNTYSNGVVDENGGYLCECIKGYKWDKSATSCENITN